MVIFSIMSGTLIRVARTKKGYLWIPDSDFADWLFSKCENDPEDGDPLVFLIDLFNPQRPPGAPALAASFRRLGETTPFRWVPTLSEWLDRYSTPSDLPNSVNWVARVFLQSQKRNVTANEIAETAELMRQLGYAPFGPHGPSTVKLLPTIPRVSTTVEPQPITLPMPGAKVRR